MINHSIEFLFKSKDPPVAARATVCISLYNYGGAVCEALDSVAEQTLADLALIVVDDCSTDNGGDRVKRWMHRHHRRFVEACLIRNRMNSGLAATRNRAIRQAPSPYVLVLDADNVLYARCAERLMAAIENSRAAAAYCILEKFGDATGLIGMELWSPARLAEGNYIDALALIRRRTLLALGGYARFRVAGWEDYDLWCRFAERHLRCVRVPEILARYRVHHSSMIQSVRRNSQRTRVLINDMKKRHPWLRIKA